MNVVKIPENQKQQIPHDSFDTKSKMQKNIHPVFWVYSFIASELEINSQGPDCHI